jgi:hypothetical protein
VQDFAQKKRSLQHEECAEKKNQSWGKLLSYLFSYPLLFLLFHSLGEVTPNSILFIFAMSQFDWPITQNLKLWSLPHKRRFYFAVHSCVPLTTLYNWKEGNICQSKRDKSEVLGIRQATSPPDHQKRGRKNKKQLDGKVDCPLSHEHPTYSQGIF